jgi:hypothetical protein
MGRISNKKAGGISPSRRIALSLPLCNIASSFPKRGIRFFIKVYSIT